MRDVSEGRSMIPAANEQAQPRTLADEDEPHVLIVMKDVRDRYAVADQLLDAGLRVTTAATFGVVEVLLEHSSDFDLLVTAQSFGEMGQFGLPQLARSVQPVLPILVLEFEAARGDGVLSAVRDAIRRWPLRSRPRRRFH